MKQFIIRTIRKVLLSRGWLLIRDGRNTGEYGPLPFWNYDNQFQKIYDRIKQNTMVDIVRCHMLYQISLYVKGIDGNVAEIGVWRGGTGRLLATVLPDKKVYLFDTFKGLPSITPEYDKDFHYPGQYNDTNYDNVVKYLEDLQNVSIIKGLFPESAQSLALKNKFCFVHVDIDLYQSAYDCCEYFYDLLTPGGIMVFDDYGFGTCPGVTKAVDTFFEKRVERPIYLPTGQSLVVKLNANQVNLKAQFRKRKL